MMPSSREKKTTEQLRSTHHSGISETVSYRMTDSKVARGDLRHFTGAVWWWREPNKMESLFNVSQFNVFNDRRCNFGDPKSVKLVLNFFHARFPIVYSQKDT